MVSTSFLTVEYLKSLKFDKKVYLIGSTGLTREMDGAGIRHFGLGVSGSLFHSHSSIFILLLTYYQSFVTLMSNWVWWTSPTGYLGQRRSQNSGDGVKLAMEGPPGQVGPSPKMKTGVFHHFTFKGPP